MLTLFHHPICPLSRQVRIYLKELDLEFDAVKEDFWQFSPEFKSLNPTPAVPTLKRDDTSIASGIYPIIEYFVDTMDNFFFMPKNASARAEIRATIAWYNDKFFRDVTKVILDEKMVRLMMRAGSPRPERIKIAKKNLNQHLKHLQASVGDAYLVGEQISAADIAAASQISVLDYFGEINWLQWPTLKHWYSVIKSRPGFKPILLDEIAGFPPPNHYKLLDF